jgi:hypothetical protein
MNLDTNTKSKIRFHLGYNLGAHIPAGDAARLEESMALIPDEYWFNAVIDSVRRCDRAYQVSEYFPRPSDNENDLTDVNFSRQERIEGDVSRTIRTSDPLKGDEYFWEIYLRECDRLAEILYVANYRRPEVRRYAFDRAGSEFILSIPGPADTAVGSRIYLNQNWR